MGQLGRVRVARLYRLLHAFFRAQLPLPALWSDVASRRGEDVPLQVTMGVMMRGHPCRPCLETL